jgi:hypothetical protein
MKKLILHTTPLLFTAFLICASCSKNCDCTMYDEEGQPTDETVIRQMPRSLKLECSFFETYTDTAGGYICR